MPSDKGGKQKWQALPNNSLLSDFGRESDLLVAASNAVSYQHREGRGTLREDLIREFLCSRLPKSVDCGKGFIQDAGGAMTSEFDLVVYDPLASLLINKGPNGRATYPVESVIAAIEVRSNLDTAAIQDAITKSDELAKLTRRYEFSSLFRELFVPIDESGEWNDSNSTLFLDSRCNRTEQFGKTPMGDAWHGIPAYLIGFDGVALETAEKVLKASPDSIAVACRIGKYATYSGDLESMPVESLSLGVLMIHLTGSIMHYQQQRPLLDPKIFDYFAYGLD